METRPPIIREHLRQKLTLPAKVRFGGQLVDGQIVNLSEAGCKLKVVTRHVQVGTSVYIKPVGLELVIGKVIWAEDYQLGVAFVQRIYRPVVDHLVRFNAFAA